jgi:hypothetical protein
MEKISLKLSEFYQLEAELNGVVKYKGFKLDELESIESDGNYPVFFKLIKVDE